MSDTYKKLENNALRQMSTTPLKLRKPTGLTPLKAKKREAV